MEIKESFMGTLLKMIKYVYLHVNSPYFKKEQCYEFCLIPRMFHQTTQHVVKIKLYLPTYPTKLATKKHKIMFYSMGQMDKAEKS
jgi:hypothetical protein